MKKIITIFLIFIFLSSLLLLNTLNKELYADESERVDPTDSDQIRPDVFGNKIVWEDYRDGVSQIYIYDISTGVSSPLDPTTSEQWQPSIYEDKVVWEDIRDGVYQIYFYDLSNPDESPIRISPTDRGQDHPVIFADNIVWSDSREGRGQIYMYSISTGTITHLDPTTGTTGGQGGPDIYGGRIVWVDYRDGHGQIYMYDMADDTVTRLCPTSSSQYRPSIYEDKITWVDSCLQIYMHDISTDTTSVLDPSSSERDFSDLWGNKAVWLDLKTGDSQVYLYDIEKKTDPVRISPSSMSQDYPAIYGNKVVWTDWGDMVTPPYIQQTHLYTIPLSLDFTNFFKDIRKLFISIIGGFYRLLKSLISPPDMHEESMEQLEVEEESIEDKDLKEEVAEEEAVEEEEVKEESEQEDKKITEVQKSAPTIELKIKEGPIYSEEDKVCFYRIEAIVTGEPAPEVDFSRDDSEGAWGSNIAQINLYSANDSYKLSASATNSEGTATDVIELNWGCEIEEEFDINNLDRIEIEKIIQGVDIGQIIPPHIVLHPSDIGYVVYPSGVNITALTSGVNTTTLIIGDSISNTDVRGYFAFDVSPLSGKDVTAATLYMEGVILGNPAFKGDIALRWGTYLPLTEEDYLMLGLVRPVTSFSNDQNPIIFSREDLVVAIENMANVYHDKLQFGMLYYYNTTDGDNSLDGREYHTNDISLIVYYND